MRCVSLFGATCSHTETMEYWFVLLKSVHIKKSEEDVEKMGKVMTDAGQLLIMRFSFTFYLIEIQSLRHVRFQCDLRTIDMTI